MRTRGALVVILIASVVSLVLIVPFAWAGGFNVGTSLTIHAPDSVNLGNNFVIKGRLRSSRNFCRRNSTIQLIRKGSGVIDTDKTNEEGKYRFETSINGTRRFHTEFDGKDNAPHPITRICKASVSDTVKVIAT